MYEKNIVGKYIKEDEYPVFKSDKEDLRPSIRPTAPVGATGAVSPVSFAFNRLDAVEQWRYMSEMLRERRLAHEAQLQTQAYAAGLPTPSQQNQDQQFQEAYEHDMTEFSSPDEYNPILSQLKEHLKRVNLVVPTEHLFETETHEALPSAPTEQLLVSQVMTRQVSCILESTTVEQAASILNQKKITGVPVVHYRTRQPLGVITLSDIMRRLFEQKALASYNVDGEVLKQEALAILDQPVRDYMSHFVVAVGLHATVKEACHMMNQHRVRRVLVLENDLLRGIFTARDAIKVLPLTT